MRKFSQDPLVGLRNLLMLDRESILPGCFIKEQPDCLTVLDNVGGLARQKRPSDYLVLLDFASDVLRENDARIFPCAAIIGAYVAVETQDSRYAARIDNLFNEMQRKFDAVCLESRGQVPEVFRVAMFEAYYCAGRMMKFDSSPLSQRVHEEAYSLLTHFALCAPLAYPDYIIACARGMVNSQQGHRFPSGDMLLVAHFESIMQEFDRISSSVDIQKKETALACKAMIAINTGLNLPDESPLAAIAGRHFSTSWDNFFESDSGGAKTMIRDAVRIIENPCLHVSSAFTQVIVEKQKFLESRRLLKIAARGVASRAKPKPILSPDEQTRLTMLRDWRPNNLAGPH